MTTIGANLQAIRRRIHAAAGNREVQLVAVSKGQEVAAIRQAHAAGQRAFGENYVQEAVAKIAQLKDLALEWHFIGPIQSNKARSIAANFDWVQSVDREKTAQRLSESRAPSAAPLNICLQVNLGAEQTKSGAAPREVDTLARYVATLPGLRLRGLMTIPEPNISIAKQRFTQLHDMFHRLTGLGIPMDTLSMGMSDDFEAAIACGSTMVRVGTLIFGPRQPRTGVN